MESLLHAVIARLPLGQGFLQTLQQALDPQLLDDLFEQHRGTGSEQKVTFTFLVEWIGNALVNHRGSGRQALQELAALELLPACQAAIYGKLRRVPVELSQALVAATAQRLQQLLPTALNATTLGSVPPSLKDHRVLIVDGKKLKNLPKRSRSLQGLRGKLLGGKVVAGFCLNDGLVTHLEATLDGEANDAPLTPGLIAQSCASHPSESLLFVADRQFCDLKIPNMILEKGQHFVIRQNRKTGFHPENSVVLCDSPQRTVHDSVGWLGSPKDQRRLRVRQIMLQQANTEDVLIVTSLLDAERYPAEDLLSLYKCRWQIEQVFQQLHEVFEQETYVGSSPSGAVFQFAMCVLLYNVVHVLRVLIAEQKQMAPRRISTKMLFVSLQRELKALSVFVPTDLWGRMFAKVPPAQLRRALGPLLLQSWSALWIKCVEHKPRRPPVERRVSGNHASAQKLILQHRAAKNQALREAKAQREAQYQAEVAARKAAALPPTPSIC